MNIQKIKDSLKTNNAVDIVQPPAETDPEVAEEEDKNWHNPEYNFVGDYELGEDGHQEEILDSLKQEGIDYNSAKSKSQFREFFYDLTRAYERYENNL